jgi:hypothetical protein
MVATAGCFLLLGLWYSFGTEQIPFWYFCLFLSVAAVLGWDVAPTNGIDPYFFLGHSRYYGLFRGGEHTMGKIRVLVANRPRLMRELVLATISDQPDIEIIGETGNDSEITSKVRECNPDVVIVALDTCNQRPIICDELLETNPQLKILALAPERNSSMFFWSVIDIRSAYIESSEDGILSALRGKVHLVA